jgi:hypothetical protein
MIKTKKESVMDSSIKTAEAEKLPIDEMPLTSLREYRQYNEEARRMNKKLGLCRYPQKPCPVELHPTERIVFSRKDQPSNPLPVYISNSLIEFKETLVPGKTYDLPQCVVSYLADKGVPIWKWFDKPDGSRETGVSHKEPRFALRTVYAE